MTLAKKEFEMIAYVVDTFATDHLPDARDREALAELFADELSARNPRFNKERFLFACGVEVE